MSRRLIIVFLAAWIVNIRANAQKQKEEFRETPDDADSTYIMMYSRNNDIRLIYGGQGSNVAYGTIDDSDNPFSDALYNNANDLAGFGITYKFIDFDLAFSLKGVQLMDEERQNLSQFRLAYSYTMRKVAIRGYLTESKGVIVEQNRNGTGSVPDVHLVKIGAQVTYYFNNQKYSFRAANFQNELQRKSAGSFLLRAEPFYRSLGMHDPLIPEEDLYGSQAGLEYVNTGGLVLMPGYGYNLALGAGRFFVSPIIFLGPGLTVNGYKAADGHHTFVNVEWTGSFVLNIGYNGPRAYAALRGSYEGGYFKLDPSYFASSDVKVTLTVGWRFNHFENFLPGSVF